MTTAPPFDLAVAHRFFSAQCFNDAWDLVGKADRTPGEDEYLISVCHASLWHWRCRADCTGRHLSIGYWQLSRVYALVGEAANSRKYGELCRSVSEFGRAAPARLCLRGVGARRHGRRRPRGRGPPQARGPSPGHPGRGHRRQSPARERSELDFLKQGLLEGATFEFVAPAKAGVQGKRRAVALDARFRGHDRVCPLRIPA